MNSDLVVRNAWLRSGKVCDIAIKNGRIEQIGGSVSSARRMIDAQSNLVTEAFVIPHLHLDKVMTGYLADESALNEYQGAPSSTIRNGWGGRASALHARAMSLYNEVYHRKVTALLKKADVGIVTNPHTGPLHVRVKDLLNAGVTVALGQDDVYDAYYPYGRCNMLEIAFLGSHLLWMMAREDREILYDMITVNVGQDIESQRLRNSHRKPCRSCRP